MTYTLDQLNAETVADPVTISNLFATILRRHADEADKAVVDKDPEKWITDREGWKTLRDQLREAAAVLNRLGDILAFERIKEQLTLVDAVRKLAEHNIPPDMQELLLVGDPTRSIPPGALKSALGL